MHAHDIVCQDLLGSFLLFIQRCQWSCNCCGHTIIVIILSNIIVCLAVDWMNNKLYWSDPEMSTIEVYDILKQERKMMITSLGLPLGIAVDPLSGYDCIRLIGYMQPIPF